VVVDFHQLRAGDAQTACDTGGAGKYAAAQFADVGHALTYVQNEAFVCQVDGLGSPQCARTPPASAYWSLWWSDGKSGWRYASVGVAALKVPAGGYVALSWQKGNAQAPPRVKLAAPPPSSPTTSPSSPTTHPTSKPSSQPTHGPTTAPTSTAPASPTGSTSASGTPTHTRKPNPSTGGKPHHHASAGPTGEAAGPAGAVTPDSGSGGGLPGWVAPLAIVALFAAGGTIALMRRKSNGGG
jgi:hypothetical protein